MTAIRLGDRTCEQALEARELVVEGPARLVRAFPKLFRQSPVAKVERRV